MIGRVKEARRDLQQVNPQRLVGTLVQAESGNGKKNGGIIISRTGAGTRCRAQIQDIEAVRWRVWITLRRKALHAGRESGERV